MTTGCPVQSFKNNDGDIGTYFRTQRTTGTSVLGCHHRRSIPLQIDMLGQFDELKRTRNGAESASLAPQLINVNLGHVIDSLY